MKHVFGDLLKSTADVILHQVNCQGVMGSGVAKQIRIKYPMVYDLYKTQCDLKKDNTDELLGYAQIIRVHKFEKYVVNLFAQNYYGYDGKRYTDYTALRECLETVNEQLAGKTVALPYRMGCDRGGGDWEVVSKMIEETLVDCDVTVYEYNGG